MAYLASIARKAASVLAFVGGLSSGAPALSAPVLIVELIGNGTSTALDSQTHYFSLDSGPHELSLSSLVIPGFTAPPTSLGVTLVGPLAGGGFGPVPGASLSVGDGTSTVDFSAIAGAHAALVLGTPSAEPYRSGYILSVTPVPEPETWAMMVVGAGLIGLRLRRRARLGEARRIGHPPSA